MASEVGVLKIEETPNRPKFGAVDVAPQFGGKGMPKTGQTRGGREALLPATKPIGSALLGVPEVGRPQGG